MTVQQRGIADIDRSGTRVPHLYGIIDPKRGVLAAGAHVRRDEDFGHLRVLRLEYAGIQLSDDAARVITLVFGFCGSLVIVTRGDLTLVIDTLHLTHQTVVLRFEVADDAACLVIARGNSRAAGAVRQRQNIGIAEHTACHALFRAYGYVLRDINLLRNKARHSVLQRAHEAADIAGTFNLAVTHRDTRILDTLPGGVQLAADHAAHRAARLILPRECLKGILNRTVLYLQIADTLCSEVILRDEAADIPPAFDRTVLNQRIYTVDMEGIPCDTAGMRLRGSHRDLIDVPVFGTHAADRRSVAEKAAGTIFSAYASVCGFDIVSVCRVGHACNAADILPALYFKIIDHAGGHILPVGLLTAEDAAAVTISWHELLDPACLDVVHIS